MNFEESILYPFAGNFNLKLRDISKFLIGFWIFLSTFYGMNLYFSINSNINDPEVNLWVPFIKDLIWLFILLLVIKGTKSFVIREIKTLVIAFMGFAMFIIILVGIYHHDVVFSYVKLSKNMFLYLGGTFVLVNFIAQERMIPFFLRCLRFSITFSLIVSLFFYFFSGIQSNDFRMYGTYGNPTSLGLIAISNLCLIYSVRASRKLRFFEYFEALVCILSVMYCGSMSIFAAFLVFLPAQFVYRLFFSSEWHFWALLRIFLKEYIFLIATFCFILMTHVYFDVDNVFLGRAEIFTSENTSWTQSDSITVRMQDYQRVKASFTIPFMESSLNPASYWEQTAVLWNRTVFGSFPRQYDKTDSTLLSFLYFFGLIGPALILLPFGFILLRSFQLIGGRVHLDEKTVDLIVPLFNFLIIVLVLNLPLQHQIEVFPTNFLIASMLGILLFLLTKNLPGRTES